MATRPWTPADMVGVTGLEWFDSSQALTATGTADGSPVTGWTAVRPGSGTPNFAAVIRDDWRPVLSTVNGRRAVYFGTGVSRLQPGNANMPVGTANKFWFFVSRIRETRSGDYYPAGYGSNQGSGVAWKMRQGAIPSSDVGNNGYNIGTVPIASTGISIIVEAYRESAALSRAWYNGQPDASTYTGTRNTSTARGVGLGYWPEYGGGSEQDMLIDGYAYGEPSDDDLRRLEGWASWSTNDNGASLDSAHPYKTAAPTVTDGGTTVGGTGAATGTGTALAAGSAKAMSNGSAAGSGMAAASGASQAGGVGAAIGSGAAIANGATNASANGVAAGSSVVAASGTARSGGIGAAVGLGIAQAIGSTLVAGTGTASGSSSANASSGSQTVVGGTGSATGNSLVSATGSARATSLGTATGTSAGSATSASFLGGLGTAIGGSTASATTVTVIRATGAASGSSTGTAIGTSVARGVGRARGYSFVVAYGTRLQIITRPPPSRTVRSSVRWRVAVDPVRSRRAR